MEIRGYKKFLPIAAAQAVDNSIFLDTADGKFKKKISGAVSDLGSSTPWFLDSNAYDVYDDFESYSLGAFADNAKWTHTGVNVSAGAYSATIVNSGYPGDATKQLANRTYFSSNAKVSSSASLITKIINLSTNKHTYIPLYIAFDNYGEDGMSSTVYVSFDKGTNYDLCVRMSKSSSSIIQEVVVNCYSNILVIAKGSNQYDCYVNGNLFRTITDASFQIWVRQTVGSTYNGQAGYGGYFYIPRVIQSKASV